LNQVPFEHKAPLGFYEVDGEKSIVPQQNLLNLALKDLEGARRTEINDKEASKDKIRQVRTHAQVSKETWK
jgi:hypothetical protein